MWWLIPQWDGACGAAARILCNRQQAITKENPIEGGHLVLTENDGRGALSENELPLVAVMPPLQLGRKCGRPEMRLQHTAHKKLTHVFPYSEKYRLFRHHCKSSCALQNSQGLATLVVCFAFASLFVT